MKNLVFLEFPEVKLASNVFINTPVIIRYEDTPMLEIVRSTDGFSPHVPIFHPDGTKLAVARKGRLFLTDEGKKANLKIRHEDHLDVCELDGKTLFEMRRNAAASMSTTAELYTPDSSFLKWTADEISGSLFGKSDAPLIVGDLTMVGSEVRGFDVGIQVGETADRRRTAIQVGTAKGVMPQIG